MTRFIFVLTTALTVLFAAAITAIRIRPYNDPVARALLPADCPAPCFMGIRPGVTTVNDAVSILKAHPWVSSLSDNVSLRNGVGGAPGGNMIWSWSGAQPDWIDRDHVGFIWVQDGTVRGMGISTRIPFGEVRLSFGPPQTVDNIVVSGRRERYLIYSASYPDADFVFSINQACPVKSFWESNTSFLLQIDFSSSVRRTGPGAIYRQC
jgi:hypothetical protein